MRLPHPLKIYKEEKSYLATGFNQGTVLNAATNIELAKYTVIDDVVVPPEYERYVIASWGDRVFPNKDEYFGYNNDYTGFVPQGSNNDGYLWVIPIHEKPDTNRASRIKPQPVIEATIDVFNSSRRCQITVLNSSQEPKHSQLKYLLTSSHNRSIGFTWGVCGG